MTRSFGLRSQAGVGIVEIMVAMAISLVLLAGLVQVFVSQKQGFLVQQSQARLQENARLASMILSSNIAKAGFHPDPVAGFSGTTAIDGDNNVSSDPDTLDGTDTLTFSFEGDGLITDCLGNTVADGVLSGNIVFRVNQQNKLECSVGGITQPLVSNIEDMQILYGEDRDATDNSIDVDRYVTRDNVINLNNVLSVHIALLMASEGNIKPAPRNDTYTLLDKTLTNHPATADQIQRRVIERVIALRNRLL